MRWTPICIPEEVTTVACVGTGLIGGGWVAHFLARGYDVKVYDPGQGAEERLEKLLDGCWPVLEKLGLAEGAGRDRLEFVDTLEAALAQAQFVQESVPEVMSLKQQLLAEIDQLAPLGVTIGSSTSGLLMTEMAAKCENPQRFVVSHPFNPPYLIPFMEVVCGEQTDPAAGDWTKAFYEASGKKVALMDKEVSGFIGNRLQEAVWRECVHMLNEGEASVEQLDLALTEGLGLRWALVGPFMTFHLAADGMRDYLERYKGFFDEPWTRCPSPEITDELCEKIIAGTEALAGQRDKDAIAAMRNDGLIAMLQALRHIK